MWMTCPAPAIQVERKKKGLEPDITLYSGWYQTYYSKREPDGTLVYQDRIFKQSEVQLRRQELRKEKREERKNLKKRLFGNKVTKKSCGFCGGSGHTRRNCNVMQDFIDDLSRANQNYRKRFYNKIVKEMGLAEGALVSVKAQHALIGNEWIQDFSGIGVVTDVKWNEINLGISMSRWNWKTSFVIDVLVDGETLTVENPLSEMALSNVDKDPELSSIFAHSFSRWGARVDEIVAPSENIPSEEWFNHGYEDCWQWLSKKYNLPTLNQYLSPVIAKWHPSVRGRNAGKLKKRLAQYGYDK
jgi:hypothetical protein